MKSQGGRPSFSLMVPIPSQCSSSSRWASHSALELGGVARAVDLWRAAEGSPDAFSLSTSSLCATPERQGLPAMPSENQHRFLSGLHRNPGCFLGLDLRPLSLCFHQSEALSGGREEDWAPCFDHRVLLMGKSKGAHQLDTLPEVRFWVHSSLICFFIWSWQFMNFNDCR